MKQIITVIVVFALILLTACSNTSQTPSTPNASSAQAGISTSTSTGTPASVPAEKPAVQEGCVTKEFMENGLKRIKSDSDAFGAFFAEYKVQNRQGILPPDDFKLFRTGELLDIELPNNAKQTGDNKVLIVYNQSGNYDSIQPHSGILLDIMALLSEEQIPDSLLGYDKLIQISASPRLLAARAEGLPVIQWIIEVSCQYMDTGDTLSEYFAGSQPEGYVWVDKDAKYVDGSFPILEAVNRALELAEGEKEMIVSSRDIVDGEIWPQYGKFGEMLEEDVPTRSFPLQATCAPAETVSFAIRMSDPDSVPIAGYEWVHWMVVNLETVDLPENASVEWAEQMIQGTNDFGTIGYGGPMPPDKPHTYVITVYALDTMLDLQNGFTKEAFEDAIQGHILAEASMTGVYPHTIDGFSD